MREAFGTRKGVRRSSLTRYASQESLGKFKFCLFIKLVLFSQIFSSRTVLLWVAVGWQNVGYVLIIVLCDLGFCTLLPPKHSGMIWKPCLQWLTLSLSWLKITGPVPRSVNLHNDLGQVVHTNVPLFTKQYNLVLCEGFHHVSCQRACMWQPMARVLWTKGYCSSGSDQIRLEPRYKLSILPFFTFPSVLWHCWLFKGKGGCPE